MASKTDIRIDNVQEVTLGDTTLPTAAGTLCITIDGETGKVTIDPECLK